MQAPLFFYCAGQKGKAAGKMADRIGRAELLSLYHAPVSSWEGWLTSWKYLTSSRRCVTSSRRCKSLSSHCTRVHSTVHHHKNEIARACVVIVWQPPLVCDMVDGRKFCKLDWKGNRTKYSATPSCYWKKMKMSPTIYFFRATVETQPCLTWATE